MKRKITKKQKAYVEARGKGISRDQSAIIAGYENKDPNTTALEKSPSVQDELDRIRKETVVNTGVTKEQVVNLLVDAAQMAKLIGDPSGLLAAARELGKMLGFYAAEKKIHLHDTDQASLKRALKEMSDDELFALAHTRTIDGTATRVPELPAPAAKDV